MSMAMVDEHGVERSFKLGYGTKVFVKRRIKRGDKLFEWDPYTFRSSRKKRVKTKFVDLTFWPCVKNR